MTSRMTEISGLSRLMGIAFPDEISGPKNQFLKSVSRAMYVTCRLTAMPQKTGSRKLW